MNLRPMRHITRIFLALMTTAAWVGCSSDDGSDAARDAGALDAGRDAAAPSRDAGDEPPPEPDAGSIMDAGTMDHDASVGCAPGESRCVGDRAEVCANNGAAYNSVECSRGCDAGACEPLSLETGWTVHQFDLTNDPINTPASYSFENDGLIAEQSANPMASVYYNERSLPKHVVVTGNFEVTGTQDDDFIGFVFGWSDPEHFYLFDWKQADQDDGTCGMAHAGATLKLAGTDESIDDCTDLWATQGTERVMPLIAADEEAAGWEDETAYELRLVFRPGDIDITVTEAVSGNEVVSLTSDDATYSGGHFGFYNYSQESVRYEFFSISPVD